MRDPRGSLYSMQKLLLHRLTPEYHCPLILDDVVSAPALAADYPGRFISITYEDFCLDPYGEDLSRLLEGNASSCYEF